MSDDTAAAQADEADASDDERKGLAGIKVVDVGTQAAAEVSGKKAEELDAAAQPEEELMSTG